jgi:hypothetical protein
VVALLPGFVFIFVFRSARLQPRLSDPVLWIRDRKRVVLRQCSINKAITTASKNQKQPGPKGQNLLVSPFHPLSIQDDARDAPRLSFHF